MSDDGVWKTHRESTAWAMFYIFDTITDGDSPIKFRYRIKPKKRTLEEVASKWLSKDPFPEELRVYRKQRAAFIEGFRAARSGEYDDVEVE